MPVPCGRLLDLLRGPSRYLPAADRAVDLLPESTAVVSDSLLIAGVECDDDQELHVLLSTDTLQRRSVVDYPHPARQRDIRPSAEPGTWLTTAEVSRHSILCLWQLDGPLDSDPLPGQQALVADAEGGVLFVGGG